MNLYPYIAFILIIPILVFLITGLFGKTVAQHSGSLGTLGMFVTTVLSYITAYNYFFIAGKTNGIFESIVPFKMTWLEFTPSLKIEFGFLLDPIAVMMLVVISTVSLMVHIYSIGYMHGEKRYAAYFSFLSLFTFSMLGLVMSTNIFQMYMFWELVGVSSFLLIGFYYDRLSAVAAAKKAFIVTRFADLGFLIGILLLSYYSESFDFPTIIQRMTSGDGTFFNTACAASFMGVSAISWALTLIFIGGAGKSAMFPLHIWLPDAMEGPTPVSALIHAATMVVAGVFLVARLFPLYIEIPAAQNLVAYTGIFSACFAAIIACTQTDIKRVLAYSTMSQIGYMMFALGVSGSGGENGLGFTSSMFHLFTHAFFKAALFLGAGAVIHYIHSNEMKDMGGLRKYMPVTNIVFLIACLAIAGIPPFSGFFSKEEILTAAYEKNKLIYTLGLITAGLTAFYMFRLYFSIFWNKKAVETSSEHHHEEAPVSMKLPLIILAAITLVAGFVPFSEYVSPDHLSFESVFHADLTIYAVLASITGIFIALTLYKNQNAKADTISSSLGNVYQTVYKKFYVDELYLFITKKIIFKYISQPAAWIDRNIVDGMMRLIANVSELFSELLKPLQSGKIADYAIWFFAGAIALSFILVYLL
jgi:NADH-quinone oxidoreductase subunit L